MEQAETLRTIAEVAIAVAGFSGVVVVLGHRNKREWTFVDTISIAMLLFASLGVVLFAFVPLLIAEVGVPVWRISNGLLGVGHLFFLTWAINRMRGRLDQLLIPMWMFYLVTAVGLTSITLNALVAAGLLQSLASFAYLGGLVWLLAIAVMCFVALLFESRRAA